MATSNTDPEIGSATNWGGELADGSNSYIMRALYNTDTRTIDEFYCNDADADNSIGDYFRQNAQGIDRLRFYDNADAQFAAEADVYGIEYIRAWKEIETQDVIDQQRADEDAEAINNAVVLGTQLPNSVSADINLVSEGPVNGSAVTWTTAPEGIVDPLTGAVSVVEEATDVTLTATVNYNGKIATKVLNITVVPPGATSQYVFEEDFEYATVDEMFAEGSRLSPSSSPFSMLALSMQNGTEVKFRQATTPKTSEAIFIDFSDYAHRLNGEHYVEIKVKKDNPRANWQLKLYPETVAVNREFVTMDVSNGNLSWRLSSGWTGAPYIPITDTNYVTVRMLLDFTNQTISEIYVDDGEDGSAVDGIQTEIIDSSDGRTVPFMNGATAIGGVAIWANNNMADGSSFDVDYVRIWDSEKSLVRADIDALTLADITAENPGEITQNVTLPAAGKVNGTEFTWTSSNEDAIALDGTVTRPQNGDAAVILTASAEADGETFEKSFYLNVSGITGGGIDDSEFDYDVYNNAFTEIGSEIDISSSANAEITDERLSVKPVDQTSSASAEINFTNEDGSFGLTGRAVVEFDASAAGGSGSYEIRSTDGSSMASVAVTDSDYTITTRDNTLTVPYRANDNLKLRFVFDTDNDTVQVWHNNIEITGETLRPITSGKNISSLNMTVSGGTEACATIDNLRVGIADSSRLQMVYDAFNFDLIKGDNASETEVRYDLNLFTEYILDSEISWTSGDTSIINPETGEVIRPQDSDKQVSLTAQIGLNDSDETRTKTFELTVKKYNASNLAQEKDVRVSVSAADGTSAANITDGSYDTAFRTIGSERSFNVTIDLGSAQQISGAAIYEGMVDGQYSITEYDIMVSDDQNTWTAVYDEGTTIGEERNIDFKPVTARYVRLAVTGKELGRAAEIREIEVVFDPTDRNRVDADTDALVLDSDYTVTEDITLPAQGEYGSEIEWRSSHEDIISADGEFTRPSTDTIVTLTATIKSGNITKEKTFTKLAKGRNAGNGGNNGGGSGGTGSSSGGSSGLPYIPQATPAPVPTDDPGTSTETFTDLETVPWAEEYIYELAERGIVYGVGDGKFDPDRGITREEAVKMIVKAFNIEAEGSADNFNDVSSSDWYSEFVRAAYAAGVVKGISDDTFGVGTKITREDFAVMITRALEYSGYEIAGNTDNSRLDGVSDYAKEAMAMMFDNGIMTGDESGNLNPKAETSRAQSAKIICMAMELQ